MSTLKNDFPRSVKQFWQYEHPYSYCGRNGIIDLHHIKKRISNSIFNSIPITRDEHNGGAKHHPEREIYFIQWTVEFVGRALAQNPVIYHLRKADMDYLLACYNKGIITDRQWNFFSHLNVEQNG